MQLVLDKSQTSKLHHRFPSLFIVPPNNGMRSRGAGIFSPLSYCRVGPVTVKGDRSLLIFELGAHQQ